MNALAEIPFVNPSVAALESRMREVAQVDLPVTHRFTPGLYVREIFMPAGTLLTSKIHLTEHPYVVSKGRARVWTEEAGEVEIFAPYTGITKPGTKRVLLIMEDTIWTTFHPTEETDLGKLEATLIFNPDSLQQINKGSPCLGQQ